MSTTDDHGGATGANPASVKAGHEPDEFYVTPILSVPGAVVAAFVIAGVCAYLVFAHFMAQPGGFLVQPEAAAASGEPLNTRLDRIDHGKQVDQPRLEVLRRLENDGQTVPQLPLTGPNADNSPEYHPEDLRADRIAGLQESKLVGPDKKFARIPIGDAMKLATDDKNLQKSLFPVQKDPIKLHDAALSPSAANAGRGVVPSTHEKTSAHPENHK